MGAVAMWRTIHPWWTVLGAVTGVVGLVVACVDSGSAFPLAYLALLSVVLRIFFGLPFSLTLRLCADYTTLALPAVLGLLAATWLPWGTEVRPVLGSWISIVGVLFVLHILVLHGPRAVVRLLKHLFMKGIR